MSGLPSARPKGDDRNPPKRLFRALSPPRDQAACGGESTKGVHELPKEKSHLVRLIVLDKGMVCLLHSPPMPIALQTAGLPSQSHQGIGARLVRRLGGAVRSAIVTGVTLACTLRRPAVSQTNRDHAAAQNPEAPAPSRMPVPRRPRTALPGSSLLPPWLAPLLTRRHRGSASISRPAFLNQGAAPFTPEACPQLSPKACAILNTPLRDCDPKTLELLFSAFAQHLSDLMSPEADITDLASTLPNLWHRLSTALGDLKADTSLPATPDAAPATPTDVVPEAPVLSPHPPAHSPPTGPTSSSAKAAPPTPPATPSGSPASDHPADATITAAAPQTPPDIAAPSAPVVHGSQPLSNSGRSFWLHTEYFARWRRRLARCCRTLFPRSVRDRLPSLPPPWRLYYAACTGPP
jgi:hypothetical protein